MHASAKMRRFLIVTRNVVVAEDLKDILRGIADSEVDTRLSLDDRWDEEYGLAFFDVPVEKLRRDMRVHDMHRAGANVVVMDDPLANEGADFDGLSVLTQPFRSTDVMALLQRLGFGPVSTEA